MVVLNLLVAAYALLMLFRHGPRAILYIAPRSVRVSGDPEGRPRSTGQVAAGEALETLGFRRLGLLRERGPLGGLDLEVDAWVHEDGTCADAYPAGGRAVAVSLLTTLGDGYQLATSNFRRKGAECADGRVRGLNGIDPDGALIVHRRDVAALAPAHGVARPVADLAARIELARRYYAGVGAAEVRRPALMSVLNATIALMLLAWSLRLALRSLGYIG